MNSPRTTSVVLGGAVLIGLLAIATLTADEPLITHQDRFDTARLERVEPGFRTTLTVADDESLELAADELVRFGHPRTPATRYQLVLLADGSRLAGFLQSVDDELVVLDTPAIGVLRLPRSAVRGLVLRLPSDPARQELAIEQARGDANEHHEVRLANGDVVSSQRIEIAAPRGRAIFVEPELQLELRDGQRLAMPLGEVATVRFGGVREVRLPREVYAWVGLRDGSLIATTALELEPQSGWLQPAVGRLRPEDRWTLTRRDAVCYLQPQATRIRYLSDRRPAATKQVEFLDLPPRIARNARAGGGPLMVGNQRWLKGLGVESTTLVLFDLNPGENRLAAEVAIDQSAGLAGSVRFVVLAGNTVVYSSPTVRGGDPPLPVDVEVAGHSRIALVVQFAEGGPVGDKANWLDVRVMP